MASDPWLEASFDAERIAFVTRRYEALRGLTNAGMGAALVAAAVTMHFLHASTAYPLSSSMAVLFIINVPSTAALEFEFRYRATFGRTEAPFEFATLVSWTGIIFVLLAAAAVIDTAFISPAPVASTVVFALGSLWVCLRDWPFRRYYLSGAVVPLVLLPLAIRLEPARAFTLMLVACAAALTIESHFDGRSGEPQTLSRESDDADTI